MISAGGCRALWPTQKPMRLCRLICAALLMTVYGSASHAQSDAASTAEPSDKPLCQRFFGGLSDAEQLMFRAQCLKKEPAARGIPATSCGPSDFTDKSLAAAVEKACAENIVSAYQTDVALRARNVALYEWQSVASDNMRILVWVVVLSGIAMAIYQLVIVMQIELWRARRATRRSATAAAAAEPEPTTAPAHQLEIGLGKVQVTSSIAGIVVLVISIAFLYLYLTEVYAMKPIG